MLECIKNIGEYMNDKKIEILYIDFRIILKNFKVLQTKIEE